MVWRELLTCDVCNVWCHHKPKPQSKDNDIHDEQPTEKDKVRDYCSPEMTFDLFNMALPELPGANNLQPAL